MRGNKQYFVTLRGVMSVVCLDLQ